MFLLQNEAFPYPEVGNEELQEIKELIAPVERFFREEGRRDWMKGIKSFIHAKMMMS